MIGETISGYRIAEKFGGRGRMKPAVRVCLRLLAVMAVVTQNAHVNADAALSHRGGESDAF